MRSPLVLLGLGLLAVVASPVVAIQQSRPLSVIARELREITSELEELIHPSPEADIDEADLNPSTWGEPWDSICDKVLDQVTKKVGQDVARATIGTWCLYRHNLEVWTDENRPDPFAPHPKLKQGCAATVQAYKQAKKGYPNDRFGTKYDNVVVSDCKPFASSHQAQIDDADFAEATQQKPPSPSTWGKAHDAVCDKVLDQVTKKVGQDVARAVIGTWCLYRHHLDVWTGENRPDPFAPHPKVKEGCAAAVASYKEAKKGHPDNKYGTLYDNVITLDCKPF